MCDRAIVNFANRTFRTITVAYTDMSLDQFEQIKAENNDFASEADFDAIERDLTVIGIIGLKDPLRAGISESIV